MMNTNFTPETHDNQFDIEETDLSNNVETSGQALTPRETEVMLELMKGKLYKEILYELGISMNTVKKHIKNIYRKLSVNNRTHAMRKYLELDLLQKQ